MRVSDLNWMQLEEYLREDDRAVVPLGSTEQHAYLSLATDAILAERVAVEAAEPVGVPVFPVLSYGVAPYFLAFPGTVSLREETYVRVVEDILDSLAGAGFRRILLVNGHGGNAPGTARALAWMGDRQGVLVKVHDWWRAPRTAAAVAAVDAIASHGSWMENFRWTRLERALAPAGSKPPIDRAHMARLSPPEVRAYIGDGNFAGRYERPDSEMDEIWRTGVVETRAAIEGPWM